jgi:hypothetical protein
LAMGRRSWNVSSPFSSPLPEFAVARYIDPQVQQNQ